jgi:hypothetical protein
MDSLDQYVIVCFKHACAERAEEGSEVLFGKDAQPMVDKCSLKSHQDDRKAVPALWAAQPSHETMCDTSSLLLRPITESWPQVRRECRRSNLALMPNLEALWVLDRVDEVLRVEGSHHVIPWLDGLVPGYVWLADETVAKSRSVN